MGKSKYIKKKQPNSVVFQRQLDKMGEKIVHLKNLNNLVNDSYQTHIEHLANFARHDMKNSVQSMDSILNTLSLDELKNEDWESLKACLENIRKTIDDFSKLAPIDSKNRFLLPELMVGVELLCRSLLDQNRITYKFNFPRKSETPIKQSFHALLQLMHNLVLNAVKALSSSESKLLSISATIDASICEIEVLDSGIPIESQDLEKIFEYGYSTTGGSGIGLFHAQYICEAIKGSIVLSIPENSLFTKKFTIKFPIELPLDLE
ncbi:HAMP domain-containing sensor histidine kinase [Dyadobacter sp. CY312]|uniref:sensor histidine kinase n=1 Tax=Dyadobacter sp. CY312 TaxID=2907303 RepID=UPI001F239CC1|nr:HAMP domain-containing sensor histidine kinase [Dyadobacter sp. CY312]MCE7039878.1 HAMP domain-containing histidine kinase [Dyadobacter sp. CY312]